MKAIHGEVHGQVQGVGFRMSCQQQAQRLGVTGWVRNLPSGSVEVWAEGDDQAVDQLADWCRTGPRWASVSAFDARDVDAVGHGGFDVR